MNEQIPEIPEEPMRRAVEAAPDTRNGTAWREDLLSVPEQLSPRLQWIKKHDIRLVKNDFDGLWLATHGADYHNGNGKTEDDALFALALKTGWKLWNEL